jgi:hypothetical protein
VIHSFRNFDYPTKTDFRPQIVLQLRMASQHHCVKQETQAGFNILTVDTTVFLISQAAAVIDDAEKHQCGRTLVRLQPQGFLDFLKIGRTQVELPAVVTVFGLKADRCRRNVS